MLILIAMKTTNSIDLIKNLRFSQRWLWRMPSSGMLRRVSFVCTNVPSKRRLLQEPHSLTSQKTAFYSICLKSAWLFNSIQFNSILYYLCAESTATRPNIYILIFIKKTSHFRQCLTSLIYTCLVYTKLITEEQKLRAINYYLRMPLT
jgi:hypothetical protein